MKKSARMLAAAMAAVMMLTACGSGSAGCICSPKRLCVTAGRHLIDRFVNNILEGE